MFIKHMCIATMAASIVFLGCGNKPSEQAPTSAPAPATEPFEILKNLQYLGMKQGLTHLDVISLTDLNVAYEAACRLNKQAGALGIVLKDQEIMDLGVTDLRTKGYLIPGASHADLAEAKAKEAAGTKMLPWMAKLDIQKLDLLPETDTLPDGKPNPEYQEIKAKYAMAAMQAGVYRMVSGVPVGMWPKLAVLETKPDPQSTDVQDVAIGFNGKPVMQVAVMKNKNGNYGIYNLTLKFPPKQLMAMLDAAK
jgi:hypothetical protein